MEPRNNIYRQSALVAAATFVHWGGFARSRPCRLRLGLSHPSPFGRPRSGMPATGPPSGVSAHSGCDLCRRTLRNEQCHSRHRAVAVLTIDLCRTERSVRFSLAVPVKPAPMHSLQFHPGVLQPWQRWRASPKRHGFDRACIGV